jgi:hypothetical protein
METVQDYEPFIGREAVDRILEKGRRLSDRRVAHVNSTYYGGGVAGILSSLTCSCARSHHSLGIRPPIEPGDLDDQGRSVGIW